MPPHTEAQYVLAATPACQIRQRLPLPSSPITAETLVSYLRRLTEQNLLRPRWLSQLSRQPQFTPSLCELTGLTERSLVSALPELRTWHALERWPHIAGQASVRAGVRAACTHCVAARTNSGPSTVTVFASHEQVLCHIHRRWTGSLDLKCAPHEQFSVRNCPDIAIANLRHQRLIRRWGRDSAFACFAAAVTCFRTWSRWPATTRAPDIRQRLDLLGITEDAIPLSPREVAAWYPNAVALTETVLSLRREIATTRTSTADVIAHGLALLRDVVPGLSPGGASDPFRQAILADLYDPPAEVEIAASNRYASPYPQPQEGPSWQQ